MDQKRIIDFAIIVLCASIVGIAAYSASDLELGMMVVF